MNVKKILVFLLVFICMAAFYYFYEYKGGEVRKEREELGKKALVFSPDSLESLRIFALAEDSSATDTVSLVRAQGRWRLSSPVQAEADSQAVARLLSSAGSATLDRVVEDSAAELSVFGLEHPRLVLEVAPQGAQTPLRLMLGSKNPTGSYIYAANSLDPGRVILLNNWLYSDLDKSPHELRDKKVLHFDKDRVEKLVLEGAGGKSLRLERRDGDWYLSSPLEAPADRDSVRAILTGIEEAKADSFIDDPAGIDPERFGLSDPGLTVKLYQENEQAVRLLYIGGRQGDQGPYYARREGAGNVILVGEDLVRKLSPEAARLRDLRLMRDAKDAVSRLRLESSAGSLSAFKSGDGEWSLVRGPDSARADNPAVDGLLWDLKELRAVDFIERTDPSLMLRFEKPFLRLEYQTGDSAAVPEELAFAAAPGGDSLALVRVSGRHETVARVDAVKARGLVKSFHDLRYKKILDFDTGEITRIRLESPQDTLELEKREDKWLLSSAGDAEAREWKVQNLLWDLSGMEFTRQAGPQDAVRLERPLLRVALWSGAEEPAHRVVFGDSLAGGGIYVRADSAGAAFVVEKSLFDGLPKTAAELKQEEQ